MGKFAGRMMRSLLFMGCMLWVALMSTGVMAADKLFHGQPVRDTLAGEPNLVRHQCLTPQGNSDRLGDAIALRMDREEAALATQFDTTIHCLVLRYNFQYETTDDPNTTGRGWMDLSRPLDTLSDSAYIEREGHLTDPPPHDSAFFDAHLQALSRYWETVSAGQIKLSWDIYPPYRDSVYQLPYPMSHYGKCDFSEVVGGLEDFFVDCIRLADTTSPEIDFSQYGAFFLFHAGADAQTDLGFPRTCNDLFSGYISFAGEVPVDDSTYALHNALMMPETAFQDGRATALNATLAHEFGHQLGLVDLYNTQNFFSQLGDFALMDDNGFGTGIDFGWPVGRVFGAIPLYPSAWSRAFLGIDDVVDLRRDTTGVELVAAEMRDDPGTKIVRVPISGNEYYLIENRLDEVDGNTTYILADQETSVIQGPVDSTRTPTGEYDFLMPGSGLVIYQIDEAVAVLDYDGDGVNNFLDNDLQWFVDERKFVRLIEADGRIHLGGNYRSGYGSADDLFRDDRNHAFTPQTNPATIDNSGNQTHLYLENISRLTDTSTGAWNDQVISFDLDIDRVVEGFPLRAGKPRIPLAPIADDLDGDGSDEVIIVSGNLLSVVTASGENFILTKSGCISCPVWYDTDTTSINTGSENNPAATYPVPIYTLIPSNGFISAGPVTGRFDAASNEKLVAVGYTDNLGFGQVALYAPVDANNDGLADLVAPPLRTIHDPIALSFGDSTLYVLALSDNWTYLFKQTAPGQYAPVVDSVRNDQYTVHGMCRAGDGIVLLIENLQVPGPVSGLRYVGEQVVEQSLDGLFYYGPIAVDMNRDGLDEVVAFSPDGQAVAVSIDIASANLFAPLASRSTGYLITTNPVAGDIDADGWPDIIVGGRNQVLAFNRDFLVKTDFPLEADDRFPTADVIASPITADIDAGGQPEIIFPTSVGNFYAYGSDLTYGFPLTSGEQRQFFSGSSAVLFSSPDGGRLGYLGGDGWFYAWYVDDDNQTAYWPMNGAGPEGHFAFDASRLPTPESAPVAFDDSRFYNYPNPVRGGQTNIRYYLGEGAESVRLDIFDLSGVRVAELEGPTAGGIDSEVVWDCSSLTSGVYRCVITVEFPGESHSAFTDIAVVK